MRLAICFSGQLRTALRCLDNLISRFLVPQPGLEWDLFAHTWTEDTRTLIIGEQPALRGDPRLLLRSVPTEEFAQLQQRLEFRDFLVEMAGPFNSKYRRNRSHPHVLAQTHSWQQSLELMRSYSRVTGRHYDLAIKLRFDLIYTGHITVGDLVDTVLSWEGLDHSFLVNQIDSAGHPNDIIYVARTDLMSGVAQQLDRRLKLGASNWDREFKHAVSSQGLALADLHETLALRHVVPAWYTILRHECPYEPDQFDHCDQFWKLYYQAFNLKSLNALSWVFTKEELRRDAEMMHQRFGHVPPAVRHLIS